MMAFYISLLGSILTGIIAYNSIKLNYKTIRREFPSTSCMKSFFEAMKYEEVSLPTFVTFVVLTIFFYNK